MKLKTLHWGPAGQDRLLSVEDARTSAVLILVLVQILALVSTALVTFVLVLVVLSRQPRPQKQNKIICFRIKNV